MFFIYTESNVSFDSQCLYNRGNTNIFEKSMIRKQRLTHTITDGLVDSVADDRSLELEFESGLVLVSKN